MVSVPGSLHASRMRCIGWVAKGAATRTPKEAAREQWRHWELAALEWEVRVLRESKLLPGRWEWREMDRRHVWHQFHQPRADSFHVLEQIGLVPRYLHQVAIHKLVYSYTAMLPPNQTTEKVGTAASVPKRYNAKKRHGWSQESQW